MKIIACTIVSFLFFLSPAYAESEIPVSIQIAGLDSADITLSVAALPQKRTIQPFMPPQKISSDDSGLYQIKLRPDLQYSFVIRISQKPVAQTSPKTAMDNIIHNLRFLTDNQKTRKD